MVVHFYRYLVWFLISAALAVWFAVLQQPDSSLHIIACDVGQGDAILVTFKSFQVLTDGGPNSSVLDCLSRHMPYWDRKIEVVVNTHPQEDHFLGLIEVVRRYKVEKFVANGLDSSTQSYQVLKNEVGGRGITVVNPKAGMSIRYGLLRLDILHPFGEVSGGKTGLGVYASKLDPNKFSVVELLSLGSFKALLTGDLGPAGFSSILFRGEIPPVDYIKIPHHGSKNGLTKELLEATQPQVAVISVGAGNRFGHPSPETIKMLNEKKVNILRTDLVGDVEIVSDGINYWVK